MDKVYIYLRDKKTKRYLKSVYPEKEFTLTRKDAIIFYGFRKILIPFLIIESLWSLEICRFMTISSSVSIKSPKGIDF